MSVAKIPDNVQNLLFARVETYEQLEALLLLHARAEPLSADTVAAALKTSVESARVALEHLVEVDLATAIPAGGETLFSYDPRPADLGEAVRSLSELYAGARLDIMQKMSTNAIERVRSRAITLFAEAFVLGRSKKDG